MSPGKKNLSLSSSFLQLLLPFLLTSSFLCPIDAQPFDYPTASLSTTWKNSATANHSVEFTDGSTVRAVLLRGTFGPKYACGFYCNGACDTYLFAIFIVQTNSVSYIVGPNYGFPQVVWSANRDFPVKVNSTLELTSSGDLVLKDADGTVAWSTDTSACGNYSICSNGQCSCPVTSNGMSNSSAGSCYLLSKVFSLMNNDLEKTHFNSTAYIKVQNVPPAPSPTRKKSQLPVIIGSSLGALFVVVLLVGVVIWKTRRVDDEEEIYLDQVPGMPTRFSYEILQATTENFSKKLGAGGFGSVFEGTLIDGTKIAVKQLEGLGQIKKSFLAEVETIGSIHHVNLRLLDIVDKCSEDMQFHGPDAVNMMRVAAWCLQADFAKRPSMSTVVKVLEGVMDVKVDLDYNFFNLSRAKAPVEVGQRESEFRATTPLLPSVLSGPR
ncbi:hypothetical protein CRG98_044831 [Punica granatum]|uniref:Bulb-type lectin domain-containing protein n=1 Tax=Punica granatum TaxID=22663 RepID=A0A2I0HTJ2_PUNGR|nr:hypothetical protein CRG98_044831 [Punica granatum]